MADELICEVCGKEPGIGVACVPSVPMSVAYGRKCLEHDAHPFSVLEASVEINGGVAETADWFLNMNVYYQGQYMTLREALVKKHG